MIIHDGKILLGKRKGAHGAGEYAFPGGHVEYLESFEQCARREVAEECGIEIDNIRFQFLANIKAYPPTHYVHVGVLADWKSGEPQVLEPEKCEQCDWYPLDQLPAPLFYACRLAIDSYQTSRTYYDF
ncbi:MAG: NUDIX domain-containing protein [Verrucomicrobiota bacterium]